MLDFDLGPLTNLRDQLQKAWQIKMDEAAMIKKKIDALNLSINVFTGKDTEELIASLNNSNNPPTNYPPKIRLSFQEEQQVIGLIRDILHGQVRRSMSDILMDLYRVGFIKQVGSSTVRRLLKQIGAEQEGERERTVYWLRGGM